LRNIYDQYSHPENRLTHALLVSLAEDRRLLNVFVRWVCGRDVRGSRLDVLEQSLPGEREEISEDEAERRGLPDGCITDGSNWALLIESKFAARPTADQLRRHVRTTGQRGIDEVCALLITVHPAPRRLEGNVITKQWSDVYAWLCKQGRRSSWARHCLDYMQVAEAKETANEYLREGKLTMFSGIPFGNGEPYTYGQAKRLLKLLREELCGDSRLSTRIRADLSAAGRPAITGQNDSAVWDFIPMRQTRRVEKHTQHPHLTLTIGRDRVGAYVTLPNGINSSLRAALLGSSASEFEAAIQRVTIEIIRSMRRMKGCMPEIIVLQRHWTSRRSPSVVDCQLRFDARTALPAGSRYRGSVKSQPQWLKAAYEALRHRQSNLEFQIGCSFPYDTCPTVGDPSIVRVIADVWLACAPILNKVMVHK
jgi:hypothetical protein